MKKPIYQLLFTTFLFVILSTTNIYAHDGHEHAENFDVVTTIFEDEILELYIPDDYEVSIETPDSSETNRRSILCPTCDRGAYIKTGYVWINAYSGRDHIRVMCKYIQCSNTKHIMTKIESSFKCCSNINHKPSASEGGMA